MSSSAKIGLPYLDAAQAQKHVTVNEALARLDMATAARVETRTVTSAPASPAEGDAHIVAAGATGDWSGQDGSVAVYLNGGWDFVIPWAGWRLWVAADDGVALYDGTAWQLERQPVSAGGALTALRCMEFDHPVGSGASSTTTVLIPDKAVVLGVTARVTEAIGGANSWSLGVSGDTARYGMGIGVAMNSYVEGVTGSPLAYYGGSALVMTKQGGNFSGGVVRFAVHYYTVTAPRAV